MATQQPADLKVLKQLRALITAYHQAAEDNAHYDPSLQIKYMEIEGKLLDRLNLMDNFWVKRDVLKGIEIKLSDLPPRPKELEKSKFDLSNFKNIFVPNTDEWKAVAQFRETLERWSKYFFMTRVVAQKDKDKYEKGRLTLESQLPIIKSGHQQKVIMLKDLPEDFDPNQVIQQNPSIIDKGKYKALKYHPIVTPSKHARGSSEVGSALPQLLQQGSVEKTNAGSVFGDVLYDEGYGGNYLGIVSVPLR